jgi:hypothetical protein
VPHQTVETLKEDAQWAKNPDELRREIGEVRADIGETVEQLSARVSPRQRATAEAQQTKGLLHRLRHAPMADSMLGMMYAPLPFVDKVHLNRHQRRTHNLGHVLVPDGYTVEVVASGFNEPVHCCFGGIDERNARHIIGDHEDFYEIVEGAWYGWPDFGSGVRLDDPYWGDGGRGREPVPAEHPDPNPPKPFATFDQHSAPNGVDFYRDPTFGFQGDAFVALFGDLTPVTSRLTTPSGFKVLRVDMQSGEMVDFAVNKIQGPASGLPHRGLERPSHCQFGPDGALYVVDFGQISLAPEKGGIRVQQGTGSLWRIRRTSEAIRTRRPEPVVVPSYATKAVAEMVGVVVSWMMLRRLGGRAPRP